MSPSPDYLLSSLRFEWNTVTGDYFLFNKIPRKTISDARGLNHLGISLEEMKEIGKHSE
jgi:hypothetical protein